MIWKKGKTWESHFWTLGGKPIHVLGQDLSSDQKHLDYFSEVVMLLVNFPDIITFQDIDS